MSLFAPTTAESRRKLIYGASACALVVFIGLGVFANNGWFPHTDSLTGKKTGWFGHELAKNAGSTWNPLAASSPTPTPQLSKEYIYAGQRLLAVEDANANATPPADLAVWRPSEGDWYVLKAGQGIIQQLGQDGDIPVAGDYDGDGKADLAVYRPSSGVWFIERSSDSTLQTQEWGGSSYAVPVPGDYDGDGKTDLAVFRPAEGNWYMLRSTAGFTGIHFGLPTDKVIPGDYDGDGKMDPAVYRDGTWYLFQSTAGFTGIQFGAPTDIASPGDFDGDGKADLSVFHPVGGTWFQQRSTTGFFATQFGQSGDKPVPTGIIPNQ